MANTFKLVTKAGVTSADTIYTVASSTTTVVLGVMVGNTTTGQITATVTLTSDTSNRAGANDEANQEVELVTNAPIPVGGTLELLAGNKVVMEATDVLKLTASSLVGKRFNGDGSTTDFTLDVAPGNVLDIEVFVGNVRQDPNSAYTLSGTTLSFTGAPPSGTNNIYVVHQAKSVGTIDVPAGGVAAGSLATSVLTGQTDIGADIADADLFLVDDGAGGTLRKTAASRLKTYAGFSVSSITGATELAAQPALTDEIVLSDAGTLKRLDIKHISNTPAFMTQLSGNQSVSTGSFTKITFDTEDLDSDGTFASNRFTPAIAGYYFIFALLAFDEINDGKTGYCAIYKNGSHLFSGTQMTGDNTSMAVAQVNAIVNLDADDYVEIYGFHNHGSNRNVIGNSTTESFFGGFRVTGV